ncbi:hypothetical protein BJ742DRAFT_803509 [Cladochytrium replicatum]|nr:hypothetical protein BJ742DRAFT_803509 [Cladochytrium replicatum]
MRPFVGLLARARSRAVFPRQSQIAVLAELDIQRKHFGSSSVPPSASISYRQDGAFLTLAHPTLASPYSFFISKSKPISHLLAQIQEEAPTIEHVAIYDVERANPPDGVNRPLRWARATSAEDVLSVALHKGELLIELNDVQVPVKLPSLEERTQPLIDEIETVRKELAPLETRKVALDAAAQRSASRVTWFGLAALCAQFGLMARLTWWEYSWDVMEPISYFLSAGTGILGYMFYIVTRKDYTYEAVKDLTITNRQQRLYQRNSFNLEAYRNLKAREGELVSRLESVKREYAGQQ